MKVSCFNHFFVYEEPLLTTSSFGLCGPGRFPFRGFFSLYIFGLLMSKAKGCLLRMLGCGRGDEAPIGLLKDPILLSIKHATV